MVAIRDGDADQPPALVVEGPSGPGTSERLTAHCELPRAEILRKKACLSDSSYVRRERPGNWRQSKVARSVSLWLRSGMTPRIKNRG